MKIDLIVITYKPDKRFLEMIQSMSKQTTPINKIIIYNTEQKYFDRIAYSAKFSSDYKNAEVHHISRREFDNGKTRNQAVKCSDADYFIMMTQDAIPKSEELVEKLVNAIEQDPEIAVAYARQLEYDDSPEYAKYIMRYFFPADSYIRTITDIEKYKSMTFQSSNVCAIYRRNIFDEVGGFINHAIGNEDVIFAASAVHGGYKVAYAADAEVCYSYVGDKEQTMKFCFDSAVSYAKHPEVFDMNDVFNTSKKLIQRTKYHLSKQCRREAFAFSREARAMMKGLKLGRRYKTLSKSRILKLTANPGYWSTDELLRDRTGVNARLGYGRSAEEIKMLSKPPVMPTENGKKEDN